MNDFNFKQLLFPYRGKAVVWKNIEGILFFSGDNIAVINSNGINIVSDNDIKQIRVKLKKFSDIDRPIIENGQAVTPLKEIADFTNVFKDFDEVDISYSKEQDYFALTTESSTLMISKLLNIIYISNERSNRNDFSIGSMTELVSKLIKWGFNINDLPKENCIYEK